MRELNDLMVLFRSVTDRHKKYKDILDKMVEERICRREGLIRDVIADTKKRFESDPEEKKNLALINTLRSRVETARDEKIVIKKELEKILSSNAGTKVEIG